MNKLIRLTNILKLLSVSGNFTVPGLGGLENCNCPTECEKTSYATSISTAQFPADYHKDMVKYMDPNIDNM